MKFWKLGRDAEELPTEEYPTFPSIRRFSYNRNMNRWQVRDEDGNTDEPNKVTAYLDGKLVFTTDSHLYTRSVDPSMGIAHGSMLLGDGVELVFE